LFGLGSVRDRVYRDRGFGRLLEVGFGEGWGWLGLRLEFGSVIERKDQGRVSQRKV
jgi:hypothetical protein